MTGPGRCHGDWQGPSDDEGVDDLLVVSCENPPRADHPTRCAGQPHRGHLDDGRRVWWWGVAGDLHGIGWRRCQFAGALHVPSELNVEATDPPLSQDLMDAATKPLT